MRFCACVVGMSLLACACNSQTRTQAQKPYSAGSCHSDADCDTSAGMVCWSEATATTLSCGARCGCTCPQRSDAGTCAVDSDCQTLGPTVICEKDPCCGEMVCGQGCADDSTCGAGFACDASHRCVAAPCQADSGCPTNFVCAGTCLRRTCTTDADCPGYCLEGACYDHLGDCTLPPD